MTGRIARIALATFMIFGLAGTAAAYEPPAGTVEYQINHSKYDEIGSHVITFSKNGGDQIVEVALAIKVKFLFITVHSLSSKRREVWRDGRFVEYLAKTDENSDLSEVRAKYQGGVTTITGPNGSVETSDTVFPTNPWNPDIVRQKVLMDTKTGELLTVSIQAAGDESVDVAGKRVQGKKYVISGDMERELWFDGAGNLLRFRFVRDGATLTFTRVTPMP